MEHSIFFGGVLCLLLAFGAQSLRAEPKWTRALYSPDYDSQVLFYLYTKQNIDAPRQLRNGDVNALKFSEFDKSKKTVVVIHGYNNNANSPITQDVKNGLLKFEDVNVIAIDWSYYTRNVNYLWVVNSVKGVGSYIGEFIDFLIDQTGISPDQVHLIGHSIGAHASGFAAKELKTKGRTVARISGLDPAWPGFYTAGPDRRLAATDAKFVDCIHSCGGLLGFPTSLCQADFYPNGGQNVQPGCSWVDFGVCSHGRSFDFYAESIDPTHVFEAQTCDTVIAGVPYKCSDQGAVMGYPATDKFLGQFYLTTRSTSPYAKNITSGE